MLIPHLHFCGDCEKAIALYEKAFDTKAENIVHNYDYAPDECQGDNNIAHAVMHIHGQKICFLPVTNVSKKDALS